MDPSLTSLTEKLRVAGPAVTRQRLTYVPVSPAADNATFQTGIERHWINHQGLCLVYASNTAGHVSNGFWPSPGYVERIKAGQQFDAECGEHMILYEDGDEECVCLAKEKVQAHPSSPHLIAHARGSNFAAYPVAAIRT